MAFKMKGSPMQRNFGIKVGPKGSPMQRNFGIKVGPKGSPMQNVSKTKYGEKSAAFQKDGKYDKKHRDSLDTKIYRDPKSKYHKTSQQQQYDMKHGKIGKNNSTKREEKNLDAGRKGDLGDGLKSGKGFIDRLKNRGIKSAVESSAPSRYVKNITSTAKKEGKTIAKTAKSTGKKAMGYLAKKKAQAIAYAKKKKDTILNKS